MKRLAVVLVCLAVVIAGISPAHAQQDAKKNYVVLNMGAYFPTSGSLDSLNSSGFNGEVAVGRYLTKNLAIELGVGAFGLSGDDVVGFDPSFGAYSYSDSVTVVPITLGLKAVIPITDKFEIYGKGGIGAYFINYDRDIDSTRLGNDIHYSDDKTVFGGFVGGGALYNINKMFYAGVEYKYHFIASVDFAPPIMGTKSYDLSGHVVTANFGFRF